MIKTKLGLYDAVEDTIGIVDEIVYIKNGSWYRLAEKVDELTDNFIHDDTDYLSCCDCSNE